MEATKPTKQFRDLFPRPWKHGLARKSKPWTMEGEEFCRCPWSGARGAVN
jgi:hypothetical protein